MNIKNLLLLSALVSIVITDPIIAVPNKSEKTKSAPSIVMTFKNDIQCLLSRSQTCTTEQKKRLTKQILIAIALVGSMACGIKYIGLPALKRRAWSSSVVNINNDTVRKFLTSCNVPSYREYMSANSKQDILKMFNAHLSDDIQYHIYNNQLHMMVPKSQTHIIEDMEQKLRSYRIFNVETEINPDHEDYIYLLATLK